MKIVRTSLGEDIASHVRRLIFLGELRPGLKVPQDTIADDLGVSRLPVREAMIVLDREGWVTNEWNKGATVNKFDEQTVHDHYELFGLIQGFAAQRALLRSPDELLRVLFGIQSEFAQASDSRKLETLSHGFHDSILTAAASLRIEAASRAMSLLVPGNPFELMPNAKSVEVRGLIAIVRAMADGDEESISSEYVKMMREMSSIVADLFRLRALLEPIDAHI